VQKIYFFFHSKYLFYRPFYSAARSSLTTPTRYAPSYMDVTVFWLVAPCIYQTTRRHLQEHQSSEAYEVTEHSKTILDNKIYAYMT
jgi:hypothetical protein